MCDTDGRAGVHSLSANQMFVTARRDGQFFILLRRLGPHAEGSLVAAERLDLGRG